eukprot:7431780-Lingulodinium_polyedra.AAC.1
MQIVAMRNNGGVRRVKRAWFLVARRLQKVVRKRSVVHGPVEAAVVVFLGADWEPVGPTERMAPHGEQYVFANGGVVTMKC